MANKKAKKDNKGAIIGICAAIVVLVVVIVAVVLATGGGSSIGDSYFQSDDTKYVLTLETGEIESEEEDAQYIPLKTHYVYTYEGDTVTGLKIYYEYADAGAAKAALDYVKEESGDVFTEVVTDGKYVVATAAEEQYEGMTADDVKQQIEFMEALQEAAADGTIDEDTEVVEGDVVEGGEEVETVETVEEE